MSRSVLELKSKTKEEQVQPRDRRSKIDRSEWPQILKRRAAGETLSQIARDYEVTPAAISNIVKRAQAAIPDEPVAAAERSVLSLPDEPESQEPEPAALDFAGQGRDEAQSEAEAEQSDEALSPRGEDEAPAELSEQESSEQPAASAAIEEHPEAKRLFDAATACAALVAEGAADDDVTRAAHEVRRALAAIEIAQSKREASAKKRPAAATRKAAPAVAPSRSESFAPAGYDDGYDDGESGGMLRGTIKFFKPEKGFGFITPDDGSKDVFVAKKTLDALGLSRIAQGDRVVFQVGSGTKGPEAKDVKLLES